MPQPTSAGRSGCAISLWNPSGSKPRPLVERPLHTAPATIKPHCGVVSVSAENVGVRPLASKAAKGANQSAQEVMRNIAKDRGLVQYAHLSSARASETGHGCHPSRIGRPACTLPQLTPNFRGGRGRGEGHPYRCRPGSAAVSSLGRLRTSGTPPNLGRALQTPAQFRKSLRNRSAVSGESSKRG